MKLVCFILILALVSIALAKPPPKLPPTKCETDLCRECCECFKLCRQQCYFFHDSPKYCEPYCRKQCCEGGNEDVCRNQCQLNVCQKPAMGREEMNFGGVGDVNAQAELMSSMASDGGAAVPTSIAAIEGGN